MADPPPPPAEGGPSSQERPRTPTITIDTPEINLDASHHMDGDDDLRKQPPQPPGSPVDERYNPMSTRELQTGGGTNAPRIAATSGPDIHPTPSFESKDSRPTSPHNISSPVNFTAIDGRQGFLSVPSNASNLRSRQNSVESDDGSRSMVSDTVVGSSSHPGDGTSRRRQSHGDSSKENAKIMNDTHALDPDAGHEADFKTEGSPFAFSPGQLNKMLDPKSLAAFWRLGGLGGLESGLWTDRKSGLSSEESHIDGEITFDDAVHRHSNKTGGEGAKRPRTLSAATRQSLSGASRRGAALPFEDRKRVFKDNRLPERKGKSLLQLMWITYNDKVLILLSIAAVVSLAIGLYQTFGQPHDPADGPAVEWVEGVAIIVAIAIVVIVGSLNDYQKERQFAKLNKRKQDRAVRVIRSGKMVEISVYDILVGDVVHLEPGDMIPVDGILIEGFNIKCDESQATGESDIIKKKAADVVYAAIENNEDLRHMDPFIQSGARVMEGVGTFLVTSTGVYSTYGRTLMALDEPPEITPLQSKLNVIAEYIAKLGGAAGLLLFLVSFILFCVRLPTSQASPAEKGQQFLNIFIVVVTIIVVAVPEGLPLAVTLALAFATTRMLKDNNLVRHLKACEVMGNATQICSDKTGTLTQNKMQVVAGCIGTSIRFGGMDGSGESETTPTSVDTSAEMSAQEAASLLSPDARRLLLKSISINSTAFEGDEDGKNTFIGSKTETSLLSFAREHLAMGPVSEERANSKVLQLFPFDSGRKCMGVVIQLDGGKARLLVKGASEIMLAKCDQIIGDPAEDASSTRLTEENQQAIQHMITTYASHSLRTIGLIYRDFEKWPPPRARRANGDRDEISFQDVCRHMVFVALVGIKDPLRPGVADAVRQCQRAGVVVRMVTGDNKFTAQAIARDCGILQQNSIVMEGPEFRNLSKAQQQKIIPRLHVLARSSPEDKRILVRRLKDKGEIVAVTGDGTNDAPALQLADVGFSMGIAGTEVAKEASAIILMDDNFASIVKALKWGRAVNDAVKRFLQFQVTVNITAVILTFVSAVSNSTESSVLTAVQLLWVNLIMDTLAALALATDPPNDSLVNRLPERRGAPIISITMWKMILGQAIYQLAITFLLFFGSPGVLPFDPEVQDGQVQTLVFNTFVWMQIFNQWNNRRLDNNFNIFEGITKNWFFIGINTLLCAGQAIIVVYGNSPFNIAPAGQTPSMWAYAIILGFLSIPVGVIIRLVPDKVLEAVIPEALKRKAHQGVPGVTVSDDEERFNYYPTPLAEVREELAFLKRVKGGRLNNLKFAMAHPRETFMSRQRSPGQSRSHSRSNSINNKLPQTPTREDSYSSLTAAGTPDSRSRASRSLRSRSNSALGAATVMSGIVAGSIAAGWSPIDRAEREYSSFPRPSPQHHHPQHQHHPSPLARDSHSKSTASAGASSEQPIPEQPTAEQSSTLAGGALTDEPQEIEPRPASSEVPRLKMPQPPAGPRKSIS